MICSWHSIIYYHAVIDSLTIVFGFNNNVLDCFRFVSDFSMICSWHSIIYYHAVIDLLTIVFVINYQVPDCIRFVSDFSMICLWFFKYLLLCRYRFADDCFCCQLTSSGLLTIFRCNTYGFLNTYFLAVVDLLTIGFGIKYQVPD